MKARLINRIIDQNLLVAEFEGNLEFTFQPGEYIQIILANGEKRYFSVASSPSRLPKFQIGTRPSESLFKKALKELPLESEVDVNGPWGDLVLPASPAGGPGGAVDNFFYFIAGGIGVTPFVSMLQYKSENLLPYDASLLHFVSEGELPPFKLELESAAAGSMRSRVLFIHKKISVEAIRNALAPGFEKAQFFAAGPPGFVNAAQAALRDLQIPAQNIIFESYTGYMN